MIIQQLPSVLTTSGTTGAAGGQTVAGGSSGSFQSVLSQALNSANGIVTNSENLGVALASGTAPSISNVMVAATQAQLAVDLTVQVRDRVVSAYNQVMNMQI